MRQLETVFNRGFWDGYYLGRKLGEWSTPTARQPQKRKIYLGKVTNYFTKAGVAEIKLETGDLSAGDELVITGPSTGIVEITVKELRDASENEAETVLKENCAR